MSEREQLMAKWLDYINNAFNGNSLAEIEFYNGLIIEIECELPFKDEEEHQKWLKLGDIWKGEPEWLTLTETIINRLD